MSDLLKESIADAKAVRETALANAKTFLEENFNTSMKQMFSEKLKEEMAEGSGTGDGKYASGDVAPEKDSSKIAGGKVTVDEPAPTKPSTYASKTSTDTSGHGPEVVKLEEENTEEITSEELDEILAELQSEVNEDSTVVSEKKESDEEKEEKETEKNHDLDESLEEEVDLDELIAELDMEENNPQAMPAAQAPAPEVPTEVPTEEPAVPAPAPAPAPAPVAGQVPSPMEGESDDVTVQEMADALIAINEENDRLRAELNETVNTVKYLKGVLNETNLLNAKLLYTNKLFKNKSLTEEQKLKVINTFDLTKNLREVKLAYTVLAESFNAGGSVVKKKTNTTAQTITEGLASKPVPSTKPEATIVAPQASELASRLQKLAGITK